MTSRREFFKKTIITGATAMIAPAYFSCSSEDRYNQSSSAKLKSKLPQLDLNTSKAWFAKAQYGLLIHYGLYSIPGRQEWIQFTEKIPVKEYSKLKDQFTANKFDADYITDLALDSGFRYMKLIVKHHDSFCLWDTQYSEFKSTNSPAKRDLVAEMTDQCSKKGLPIFLGYSHGRDWRHPHAPRPKEYESYSTRPAYEKSVSHQPGEEAYDLNIYVEYANNQIKELLTNYGNIAGISLGGASTAISGPLEAFRLAELYDNIRTIMPHALISYGKGVTGNEDYASYLRIKSQNEGSPVIGEICDTLQPKGWGYNCTADGKHKTGSQVIKLLDKAASDSCNLLLNTGPLPAGDLHPEDLHTIKEVGKILKGKGIRYV